MLAVLYLLILILVYFFRSIVMPNSTLNNYYKTNLKDKDADRILSAIRKLKHEIGHIKNFVENKSDKDEPSMTLSERKRLDILRACLDMAKNALSDVGGEYSFSQAELRAKAFDDNINSICKIMFSIGTYFSGYTIKTVILKGDEIKMYECDSLALALRKPQTELPFSKTREQFIDELMRIHLGEWKRSYNKAVIGGKQWELEIHFSNGTKVFNSEGIEMYPYNFKDLKKLMEIEI